MKLKWTSNLVIIALLIGTAFLGQQKFRQYRLQKTIETEKTNLQNQLNELEGKNHELKETLGYLNSDSYKELIARQQLNMQKNGEFVYTFTDEAQKPATNNSNDEVKKSSFQKWVSYFLNKPL